MMTNTARQLESEVAADAQRQGPGRDGVSPSDGSDGEAVAPFNATVPSDAPGDGARDGSLRDGSLGDMSIFRADAPWREWVQPLMTGSIWRRVAFWAGGGVVFAAAAVATLAPAAVGAAGLILLLGLAGAGGLLLYGAASGLTVNLTGRADAPGAGQGLGETFDALPEPALLVDADGAPQRANAAYDVLSRQAGVMGESARPPGFDRVLGAHPAVAAAVFRLARAARRGEALRETLPAAPFGLERTPRRYELDVAPLPGGRSLWRAREASLSAASDAEGAPVSADALLDDAPIGFFSADAEGRVVHLNATLKTWIGPAAERPDLKLGHFIAGDPARALGAPEAVQGRGPVRAEVTLRARDGIASPALIVTTWPEASDGRPLLSRSVVYARAGGAAPVGVAQAMAATSETAASSTMDTMFANAPFGVARLDRTSPADAGVSDANPALLHMTDGAAAPGGRFADLFVIEQDEARQRFARADAPAAEPLEVALAGTREKPAYAHVYFAPDGRGRLTAYVVDVTQQKELEAQLFHSQKMRAVGTLAGGVAHDMRNMLQAIVGSTYELLRRHPLGDPSYPYLVELEQHVARGRALLRQLLAYARQETVKPEVIDVGAFVSDTSVWLGPLMGEKVKVETLIGRETPHVKMGRPQLESVLMNLAANARDAMASRSTGVLEIRTRRATHEELRDVRLDEVAVGEYAAIDVSDTGCGMNEETLEKVFEPFFTTKQHGQGTGLGLATVFGVVRQAGGHVLVESKTGVGSTFRIYLPACAAADVAAAEEMAARNAAAEAAAAAEEETTDLSGSGRILLVEDNEPVRAFTARMLESQGYEVLQAEDGRVALDIVQEQKGLLDLIVSDVMMPEMDGPTFLKEARPMLGDAPVVFISGYAESEFSDLLGDAEHVHFLAKPFKLDQLARRVKVLLAARD